MCTGTHDFIPAAGTAKAVLNYQGPGGDLRNVLYFAKGSAWVLADLNNLGSEISEQWQDRVQGHVGAHILLEQIECFDVENESGPGAITVVNESGGKGEPGLP